MRVQLLGSSGAVPFSERDTTMIHLLEDDVSILVDCGGSVISRMNRAGLDWESITHLCLTHRHIDHIYGIPHLFQGFYLVGRTQALHVIGPSDVLEFIPKFLAMVNLAIEDLGFPLKLDGFPHTHESDIIISENHCIELLPVVHSVPTLAYKFVNRKRNRTIVYSADTGFCEALIPFSRNAELLIHEASLLFTPMKDEKSTHSTVVDAAKIAGLAEVKKLWLVHFNDDPLPHRDTIVKKIREFFSGETEIGQDFMVANVP